jgi:hypothetical protein
MKVKIDADLVILVDMSSSMVPVLGTLRTSWISFLRHLLDPTITSERPQVDLRLKVVGYAMSEDGTQPVIQDNPFVHNDVAAFDTQFANLKLMQTNHSPRPLLDALWRVISVGSMPRKAEGMDPAKWRDRKVARRVVAIYSDAPFREQMLVPDVETGKVEDVINLVMANRVWLNIFAPEHECYDVLCAADQSEWSQGDVLQLVSATDHMKEIMRTLVVHVSPRPPLEPL